MRLSIFSVLSLAGAGMVSALPQESSLSMKRSDTSECVGPLLCCGTLTTPLDPLVDPLLLALGIDAANIVGSIGLLCHGYEASSCDTKPQCCTEANLLGGTLALGCADLKE
ncbi:fungal hydrophobin [Penicillium psychrosexuale]|uniref:fungal hydrophobin n=1 Tax=Penicillium psychrosexuale TaxID=1002107 RepID=UPI002544F55F|nr:fungal hydrophobin [Penicillium psychrosexuale]KAJ5801694.1 fungal hydrophobin [Penicillium psychrosexuale]